MLATKHTYPLNTLTLYLQQCFLHTDQFCTQVSRYCFLQTNRSVYTQVPIILFPNRHTDQFHSHISRESVLIDIQISFTLIYRGNRSLLTHRSVHTRLFMAVFNTNTHIRFKLKYARFCSLLKARSF